jgi:two-component system LytT family response regulator
VLLVPVREIHWFEARRNSVRVHTKAATWVTRDTLGRLAKNLASQRFARIHRSTLVNLDQVREILVAAKGDYDVVLEDGSRHTVGRHYRQGIRDVMAELAEKRR